MLATTTQIVILIVFVLGVLLISVYAYYLSVKKDRTWFYVYTMMLVVLVQWMSDTGAALIYQTYYLHLASIIIFPSIIFSLIVIYIVYGTKSTRQMLSVLIFGIVGYAISLIMLYFLNATPQYIQIGLPWFSNHLFSSLALIVDVFILVVAWPILHNQKIALPLLFKIWAICWLLLITDSLVFNLGTFWNTATLSEIIYANLIVRTSLSIIISPLITIYISTIKKSQAHELAYRSWADITSNIDSKTSKKIDELENLKTELMEKNIDLEQQRKALTNLLEDVQSEKEIVATQAESLQKFETASEQSNEMIVFTDADGIVEWANKSAEVVTGFTVKESIGLKAGLLWGKLMPLEWYKNLWDTIKIDKKIFIDEVQNHRKNGEKFWSSIVVYPLLNEKGEVTSLVSTQRDVTHEKQVDQMKTEFISLASHQLRTPLSAMKWFIEMLLAGDMGKLSDDQLKAVENIDQSNERMITLVNGLLNISRIESGRIIVEPVLTDITNLTNNILSELKQKIDEKKLEVTFNHQESIGDILLDQSLVRQVILNLLTNSIKYTNNKGNIAILITKENNNLKFSVTDNGLGIPKLEQTKVFQRFFRASNVQRQETDGTGLGLYLAKTIINSSGGEIGFTSTEGKESNFWFTIPLEGMKPKLGEVKLS